MVPLRLRFANLDPVVRAASLHVNECRDYFWGEGWQPCFLGEGWQPSLRGETIGCLR